ncbi:hypothetical protein P280DRAFT_549527 [Massarina eburnea CBS 473.64]|uniref:Mid2 domain-containing protein n=1 Tax=Massarina eburnea CBS 473.64 TaxID=1395130 RepID=A0A6A6S209_9PLEO|nr:hypothetical protein P280DRAFT_549527 [Massarina eburnea CBS 473.64]
MKIIYSLVISLIAPTLAQEYVPPQNNTPAISFSARNPLDRRAIDYCGSSSYYCVGSDCCGITTYNCLPSGAECCASLSTWGYGLYCLSGTSCVVVSGYIQCQKTSGGGYISAGSSARPTATGTSTGTRRATATPTSTDENDPEQTDGGGSGSGSSSSNTSTKKKSKGKAWIAGAVVGPLIGIALVGAVVFFLCVVKKKQKKKAEANNAASIVSNNNPYNNNNNGGGGISSVPPNPPMSPAPNMGGSMPEKTPTYYQQYEVPTPIASPPPQWSPAAPTPTPGPQWNTPAPAPQNGQWTPASPVPTAISPAQTAASPAPIPPPQTANELYGDNAIGPVSPTSTGNGGGYAQPMQTLPHQPQPVRGNAMELPTNSGIQSQPRHGAHELGEFRG